MRRFLESAEHIYMYVYNLSPTLRSVLPLYLLQYLSATTILWSLFREKLGGGVHCHVTVVRFVVGTCDWHLIFFGFVLLLSLDNSSSVNTVLLGGTKCLAGECIKENANTLKHPALDWTNNQNSHKHVNAIIHVHEALQYLWVTLPILWDSYIHMYMYMYLLLSQLLTYCTAWKNISKKSKLILIKALIHVF